MKKERVNIMSHRVAKLSFPWAFAGIFFIGCLSASCQVKKEPEEPIALTAAFLFSPASPVAGQSVQFTDTSTGRPTSWQWSFGDGGTSTSQNPSHTYTAAGSYGVTLTVQAGSNSDSTNRTLNVLAEAPGYYVDTGHPGASDSNPGTEALPWETLTKANQTLAAGEKVIAASPASCSACIT